MNRAVRMVLVLSLLTAFSVPAFPLVCRACNDEIGCSVVSQPTNTWCKFVDIASDCRQISSPGCTPAPGLAMVSEFDVASIELTRPSESITIVSNHEPAVSELSPPADTPQK
ncbi:MAG TPA: hypothetical protein VE974_07445 [Thermoanaerobaculia bacterium]|nr:hypothetical protein [Thermoanaerobaculia bacterium]